MTKSDWSCHDVQWYAPGLKRPIAYTTRATSDMIEYLAEGGLTISQIRDSLVYDDEGARAMQSYVDRGYGGYTKAELDRAVRDSNIKVA